MAKRAVKGITVNEESLALKLISEVGPGGSFAGEPHTAAWFRREMWEPTLWERRNFAAWQESDGRTDIDRARERVLDILAGAAPPDAISEEEERKLRAIIQKASR